MAGGAIQHKLPRIALIVAALLASSVGAQNKVVKNQQAEQTSFGSDVAPGQVLIDRPVEVPKGALQVLRNTEKVLQCIEFEKMTPEQVPASWFTASEIHLNGPDEIDLIVQPALMTRESPPPDNSCLQGAHVAPFWVLRKRGQRYELLLETYADVLHVLDSRTKEYRDIEEFTTSVATIMSTTLRFDGEKYQPFERQEKPAGTSP